MMHNKSLRVAIAGCHRMLLPAPGSHNFAAAFQTVPETQVVAVFDHGSEARTAFADCWRPVWGEIPTYGEYQTMLAEQQPDVLCIATRQTMHADQIEQAVQKGVRGILCDKPLSTSLAAMDRIIKACANIPLIFALDRRWTVNYHYLREEIANGLVGSVTSITAYNLPNTVNHGCHWNDMVLALVGDPEPLWVSALLTEVDIGDERGCMDPPSRAQVGLDNGVVAYITPDGPTGMGFEVIGEKGRLSIVNDATEAYLWLQDSGQTQSLPLPLPGDQWPAGTAMVQDLVQAVCHGTRSQCDIDQARRATEISFAIHNSAALNGARVILPAIDRSLVVESFPWGNEQAKVAG